MAQINCTVGAIEDNKNKIIDIIQKQQNEHDIIVFPELTLTGYPPEDLLLRKELHHAVQHSLKEIQAVTTACHVIVGHPTQQATGCYNSLSVLYQGQRIKEYHKQNLPNYAIFDEARYFIPGPKDSCIIQVKEQNIGLCICEDLWQPGPVEALLQHDLYAVISMNASPFDYNKHHRREALLKKHVLQGAHFIYVNQVCGQDELLFDGQSFVMNKEGTIRAQAPAFEEALMSIELNDNTITGPMTPALSQEALIYKGLVYGTKDYIQKNGFSGALIGASGGIDSALTLAIAVDALGADKVHAVLMPSRYTASMSNEDALAQIKNLNVSHSIIPIEPIVQSVNTTLEPFFVTCAPGTTAENIQARTRGLLLMALSNKTGYMVLTTSNKSETAVGYATLYGDMVGGLAVLQDVLKTQVYALVRYRNSLSEVIPQRVISRAPSAELKDNQTDQDNLPDYDTLDAIIVAYVEQCLSMSEIVAQGFAAETVQRVITMIHRSEYKRRQAAPGLKISSLAFGKDWRYPISQNFS